MTVCQMTRKNNDSYSDGRKKKPITRFSMIALVMKELVMTEKSMAKK